MVNAYKTRNIQCVCQSMLAYGSLVAYCHRKRPQLCKRIQLTEIWPEQRAVMAWSIQNTGVHLLYCTGHRGGPWPPGVQRKPHTGDRGSVRLHTLSSWYYQGGRRDAWEHTEMKWMWAQTWHRVFHPECIPKIKSPKSLSMCATDVTGCNGDNSLPSHSMRSCSMLSIMAARASTPLMISFSSSVSSAPGGPPDTLFILHLTPKQAHTHTHRKWTHGV